MGGSPTALSISDVGLGHPSLLRRRVFFRNIKKKLKPVQYVHAVGEQPGPAPACWCPFSPPVSLQPVSHTLAMQTQPKAACERSWRAEPGWDPAVPVLAWQRPDVGAEQNEPTTARVMHTCVFVVANFT